MTKRKLVIVTEFEQQDFFQWFIALKKYTEELNIEITPVIASSSHRRVHNGVNDEHWNPIRTADFVFIYVTRMEKGLEWWTLPQFVKQFMRPDAKMIAQYDDEFVWLFHPETTWWDYPNPPNNGPEQFFKETGILEIPDVHLCVMENPLFKPFTKKPIYQMMLPQLTRYNIDKYSPIHQSDRIAVLIHSPWQASIEETLKNVIRPLDHPVMVFSNKRSAGGPNFCNENLLPKGSRAIGYIPKESFVDLLWQCSIAIDDNVNYIGWSRFIMECAIAYVPCVGSTDAVKTIFPELHTAPLDYAKQIELIRKLQTDKKFYQMVVKSGRERCMEFFSTAKLCRKLIEIFDSINKECSP
jgi:hypothetical protein